MWTWLQETSTALHGAAHPAVILALMKNYLSIRAYPCHPAPHRFGGQEACQVNGLWVILVTFCKFDAMLEQHVCLLHNVWPEACDLFHTMSLCGLSRFRPCFLVGSSICCLAQSMQTPLFGGKPWWTLETPLASSTSSCSSLLTSPDSDEHDEHKMWNRKPRRPV